MNRLRAYFYSGWAFLIPYILLYLLYYALKWPVNPSGVVGMKVPSETLRSTGYILPCLLHSYWALHAVHLVLAGFALRDWWITARSGRASQFPAFSSSAQIDPKSIKNRHYPLPSGLWPLASDLWNLAILPLLPWLLLALFFFIPGVYLEWPSDPWAHLSRINEWQRLKVVGEHSAWLKSSYFMPYSLIGWAFGLRQFFWLDFYYTSICLLLCWQYYRFARAVGLGERASFVFVLLQAILFGNNIFSFYRYYGISTSIYAQIAAIALTRLGLEFTSDLPALPRRWLKKLCAAVLLGLLVGLNHIQGIGLAAMGLFAVGIWRLIEWKRSTAWPLSALAIISSVAVVLWYPRHSAIDLIFRPQGWVTSWYGFNLFALNSPASGRTLEIIGTFGFLNLAAALLLLRRNHLAAWLTLVPGLLLCLPCVAIPFASALAAQSGERNIVTFHRMYFAIPTGLALVCLGSYLFERKSAKLPQGVAPLLSAESLAIGIVAILTVVSPGYPTYNRFWNSIAATPADLRMEHVAAAFRPKVLQLTGNDTPPLLTTEDIGSMLRSVGIANVNFSVRSIGIAISEVANNTISSFNYPPYHGSLLFIPSWRELYTHNSLAGKISGHWPPSQVGSDHAAGPQLATSVLELGGTELQVLGPGFYRVGKTAESPPDVSPLR